jgi:hypothetical protein
LWEHVIFLVSPVSIEHILSVRFSYLAVL